MSIATALKSKRICNMLHTRATRVLGRIESQNYENALKSVENVISDESVTIDEIVDIKTGDNALHRLFQAGISSSDLKDFMSKFDSENMLHSENKAGISPIDFLFTTGNVHLLQHLEDFTEFDIKSHSSKFGNGLHLASRKDNPRFISFLLKKGVDANENNASGHKPIDVARRYANFQNIDVFEFAHENPDRFRTLFKQNNNEEGFTP